MKQASRHTLKAQMLDSSSSSSRCEEVVWGSPPLRQEESESVTNCRPLSTASTQGTRVYVLRPAAFLFFYFPSSILFFCPLFRSRFWLGGGTANTRLDLGTETTWVRAPQVLGYVRDKIVQSSVFETHPEFLDESRRRVRSPTCLLYPAVKWKIYSVGEQK